MLYLDLEDVLRGLADVDPALAIRFVEEPRRWLDRLAAGSVGEASRRWLVLRCYVDPAGWVPHPAREGERLYLSTLRSTFAEAGFEVIDCPSPSQTGNGALVRLVIDAVEALRAEVHFEEFVIASRAPDLAPLLVRLRASDRRTTLLSPGEPAAHLAAVADRSITDQRLRDLLRESPPRTDPLPHGPGAIDLTALARDLRRELGTVTMPSRWFRYDDLARVPDGEDTSGPDEQAPESRGSRRLQLVEAPTAAIPVQRGPSTRTDRDPEHLGDPVGIDHGLR